MEHYKGWIQLAPCPKCGEQKGWYEKLICKYEQHYDAAGNADNATTIERVRGGERRFCVGCSCDITDLIGEPAA
ncbi:hypothetical protein F2S72_09325 [Pseudomonas syringae pv. actinidiae]|nr:hypothetical protein [Pseudomonas syringae pv. actinidiae]